MKKVLTLAFLFFSFQMLHAQDLAIPTDEPLFEIKDIDVPPDFPRGIDNFYAFFDQKFKKPQVPDLIGKLFLSFTVEKDGSLTDIRVIKDIGFGTGEEAERVLQLSPKWLPGEKDGKKVRVNYILAIGIHTD
jgi:Gram-negative bacterial TonB protein C-terminal